VAVHAKLDGLCFIKQPILQYILGAVIIIGAFSWFFISKERNVQHTVEGSQQLGLFLGSIVAGYAITAILASIIQAKVSSRGSTPIEGKQQDMGIETLKTKTLLGGIASSLKQEGRGRS
jgi:hypothetical protein